ncbi:hypothetical protein WA026_005764 [Henosepilachna vigintioctopunctata]|uniref:Uncharacterized protein n=1 Tax=Henosepilachna vigintioctopunctata TaxID=420089 RepID=A0AAW1U6G5_9CUCU
MIIDTRHAQSAIESPPQKVPLNESPYTLSRVHVLGTVFSDRFSSHGPGKVFTLAQMKASIGKTLTEIHQTIWK